MRRYTPPAWLSSIIVLATLQVAQAILAEAALSFLGVGPGTSTRCGDRWLRRAARSWQWRGGISSEPRCDWGNAGSNRFPPLL